MKKFCNHVMLMLLVLAATALGACTTVPQATADTSPELTQSAYQLFAPKAVNMTLLASPEMTQSAYLLFAPTDSPKLGKGTDTTFDSWDFRAPAFVITRSNDTTFDSWDFRAPYPAKK